MHVPLYVDAVQVTEENMNEVADWCGGQVRPAKDEKSRPYIWVNVLKPMTSRQSQAFPNDWVLKTKAGYKIYTPNAFENLFVEVTEKTFDDKMQSVLDRA